MVCFLSVLLLNHLNLHLQQEGGNVCAATRMINNFRKILQLLLLRHFEGLVHNDYTSISLPLSGNIYIYILFPLIDMENECKCYVIMSFTLHSPLQDR